MPTGHQPTSNRDHEPCRRPPTTRYQGSKLKLLPWIWEHLRKLDFNTVLDAFGGTASVSYLLKSQGKRVTFNDYLKFNQLIGVALVENSHTRLTGEEMAFILAPQTESAYDNFIATTFADVFYTDEENAWLDMVCQNILRLNNHRKQALAYYALFQSCIIKRPYNLFHRRNLYMRTSAVDRTFGNKATWDKPFAEHYRHFVDQANAAVFDSGIQCDALCHDAMGVPGQFDLVYMDPPYVRRTGIGVDYLDFYHFLEGTVDYGNWRKKINRGKKHLPLLGARSPWSDAKQVKEAFRRLLRRHSDSILVISYRSDGIPSETELVEMLGEIKETVSVSHYGQYQYALSKNARSKEILLIGR